LKFSHDGLSLWYGTADAPAPIGTIVARSGARVFVGVHPACPTNGVHVLWRVDGGHVRSSPGRELWTDYAREAQYFVSELPPLPSGEFVEYGPVLTCAGRQVPASFGAQRLPSSFRLSASPRPEESPPGATSGAARGAPRFSPALTFVADMGVRFERPQFVGETPEGIRVDYLGLGGDVSGPALNGKLLAGSADHLFVRPDGIGMIRVRAVAETNDGAMLEVEYTGSLELGEDGYERARTNTLPAYPGFVIAMRILTGHPRYRWLNRAQLLGFGQVSVPEARMEFSLFAAAPPAPNPVRLS
jgi:hypothetical protein